MANDVRLFALFCEHYERSQPQSLLVCHSNFFVLAHLNDSITHTQPFSRVLITGEVFGNRHVGANYMVGRLSFVSLLCILCSYDIAFNYICLLILTSWRMIYSVL